MYVVFQVHHDSKYSGKVPPIANFNLQKESINELHPEYSSQVELILY